MIFFTAWLVSAYWRSGTRIRISWPTWAMMVIGWEWKAGGAVLKPKGSQAAASPLPDGLARPAGLPWSPLPEGLARPAGLPTSPLPEGLARPAGLPRSPKPGGKAESSATTILTSCPGRTIITVARSLLRLAWGRSNPKGSGAVFMIWGGWLVWGLCARGAARRKSY